MTVTGPARGQAPTAPRGCRSHFHAPVEGGPRGSRDADLPSSAGFALQDGRLCSSAFFNSKPIEKRQKRKEGLSSSPGTRRWRGWDHADARAHTHPLPGQRGAEGRPGSGDAGEGDRLTSGSNKLRALYAAPSQLHPLLPQGTWPREGRQLPRAAQHRQSQARHLSEPALSTRSQGHRSSQASRQRGRRHGS